MRKVGLKTKEISSASIPVAAGETIDITDQAAPSPKWYHMTGELALPV